VKADVIQRDPLFVFTLPHN